ncbi:uncharacterized protein LOC142520154 [Primulina tabacum]|uniref:uncharacterized protein LOC142520154 n=2 Tax=Primulina tabacum TaxID=48773 RepID=UPI003F5AB0ED
MDLREVIEQSLYQEGKLREDMDRYRNELEEERQQNARGKRRLENSCEAMSSLVKAKRKKQYHLQYHQHWNDEMDVADAEIQGLKAQVAQLTEENAQLTHMVEILQEEEPEEEPEEKEPEMAGRPPRQNRNPHYANNNNANEGGNGPPHGFSLNQADLMAIATIVATTLEGLVNPNANQPPPPPPQHGVKFHYESLCKNRYPTLSGAAGPEVSQSWLKSVETRLRLLEVLEALKADVIVPFLEDKAGKWWEVISPAMTAEGPITWQRFREAFLKQYYPAEVRLQKMSEFENFSQAPDMSVVEYTSQFNALGSYAPEIMTDEVLKLHRFKKRVEQQDPISSSSLPTCQLFTDICRREGENRNKRPLSGQHSQEKPMFKRPNQSECPTAANRPAGPNRGTGPNAGAGPSKPKEDKPNAIVFAMTQEEADEANEVVSGTILIQQVPAYALFECGATHSFMSKRFAKKQGWMDWLARNNAIVDCKRKRVKLRTPDQEEVVFQGKSKGRKSLLSASKSWKVMKSGEDIYLAMVSEIKEEVELKLEDIPIVREFPDVFPEELSGIVPNREVEFEINLVSGHVISKEGVPVDPRKVEAITEWPRPKNATDIRSLIGLAGYYRKFVERFSSIAVPLTKLTQKNSKFIWSEDCEKSFLTLKEKLASTYHPGKANKVADALSRKGPGKVTLASLSAQPYLQETVKLNQDRDPVLTKLKEQVREGKSQDHQIDDEGILWMKRRPCLPDSDNLRQEIMAEAHKSKFSVHQGSTKMYRDIKSNFWWNGMKRDVAEFVSRCQVCQQVKAEHQRPGGLLQPLEIPEWKWEHISMDFLVGLQKSRQSHDGILVIVDRLTKTAHFLSVRMNYNLDKLASLYMDNIVRLHGVPVSILSDRDPRRPVEFNVGEKAYVKVSPMRGVVRFCKAGKLNPRYVGPFEILEKVGTLACRLALPPSMSRIHNVFHVSQLRRYIPNPSHVLEVEPLLIEGNLGEELKYEEVPIRIVDTKEQVLRRRIIPYVTTEREATWEVEENMRKEYPYLFGDLANSSSEDETSHKKEGM